MASKPRDKNAAARQSGSGFHSPKKYGKRDRKAGKRLTAIDCD